MAKNTTPATPEEPQGWKQEFDLTEDASGFYQTAPDPLRQAEITDTPETSPEVTVFETAIKALRPYMKSYSLVNDGRVKLVIDEKADATGLNSAIHSGGKYVERGQGNTVFVRFEAMNSKDAKKIVVGEFSEAQGE